MKRIDFIELLKSKCADSGYNFQHGFIYRMDEGINGYPLFWFCPPKLIERKIDGIASNSTYEAVAYVHTLNDRFSEYQKEEVWQGHEDFAIEMLNSLSQDSDVIYVVDIKTEPDEFQFKDGTISTQVSFKYQLYDCE